MFVLFLASAVNLASTNPVCTECGNNTADSASKKMDYNVQFRESGKQYNETIEVDKEKQTELFKVPAQRDAKASNILHDFKKNLSMLLLPEKRVCYLLPLDKELSPPRKLIHDLDGAKRITSKTTIIDNKWTVGSELTDRSVLSDELAAFCADFPIYHAKKLENFMTVTRIQKGGIRNRRTTLYPEIDDSLLCLGGNKQPSASEVGYCFILYKRWRLDCKEFTTYQEVYVCPSILYCFLKRLANTFICCEYVCD